MAIITHKLEGVTNDVTFYAKVFTVNPEGRANNRADVPYVSVKPQAFPTEPTSYELIETVTASKTFTAPEDGYYQIEVFGASGNGGNAWKNTSTAGCSGAGGGSGGYAMSTGVILNKGDVITLVIGSVGSTTSAAVDSTVDDSYDHTLQVTSGANGANGVAGGGNQGGAGGVATGGNATNINGNKGNIGNTCGTGTTTAAGGTGGAAVVNGGTVGGTGGAAKTATYAYSGSSGQSGFVKIYRGNTNVVS